MARTVRNTTARKNADEARRAAKRQRRVRQAARRMKAGVASVAAVAALTAAGVTAGPAPAAMTPGPVAFLPSIAERTEKAGYPHRATEREVGDITEFLGAVSIGQETQIRCFLRRKSIVRPTCLVDTAGGSWLVRVRVFEDGSVTTMWRPFERK